MNFKQAGFLFLLALFLFTFYFLRQDIIGADSYFYLNQICKPNYVYSDVAKYENALNNLITGNFSNLKNNMPPLLGPTLKNLPCNFMYLKIILFSGFLLCLLSIALLGELFNKKEGWKAALFTFLSPLLAWEFLKFENDQLAIPLLFLSMYFFFKGSYAQNNNKKYLYQIIAVLIAFLAAGFWGGSLFIIIAYGFSSFIGLIFSVPILFFLGPQLFNSAAPVPGVYESIPFIAIFYILPFTFFLLYGYRKVFLPQLFFLLFLGFLNAKFIVLSIPLLCICTLNVYSDKIFNKKVKWWPRIKITMVLACIVFAVFFSLGISKQHPTTEQWTAIKQGLQISREQGKHFANDWDIGYWVHWLDGNASAWGGPQDINFNSLDNAIVVTHSDTNQCQIIKSFETYNIFSC